MISNRSLFLAGIALALLLVLDSRAVGPVISARSESVTNTGNATAADVASGKTFSSASLTNATGTNTKNASVDAGVVPILPVQAYVNNIGKFCDFSTDDITTIFTINVSGQGITSISPDFLLDWAATSQIATAPSLDASNNAITNVGAIMAALRSSGVVGGVLDISGGTNAACTGQCATDESSLIEALSWTVTTN